MITKTPALLETGGEQVNNMAAGFGMNAREQTATPGVAEAVTGPLKLQGRLRFPH